MKRRSWGPRLLGVRWSDLAALPALAIAPGFVAAAALGGYALDPGDGP